MKKAILAIALVSLLALGGQSFGELCTVDAVPAATLLLPYFEVDVAAAPGQGIDTFFSINNASAAPALAHVTMWSDWSFPVLDFDVFLTGYDVQTVSLYNVLVNGAIPVTADDQSDIAGAPASTNTNGVDDGSPSPIHNEWDGSFDGSLGGQDCINFFPLFTDTLLDSSRRADIQAKLTGQETTNPVSGLSGCHGADHSDTIARGYITVDSVNGCSINFPSDDDYFSGGLASIANEWNILWGDFYYVNATAGFAHGDTLVHIEADVALDNTVPGVPSESGYTFYRRYTILNGDADRREPLGTVWGARYQLPTLVGFTGGTDYVVWRDSTSDEIDEDGWVCGAPGVTTAGPGWHPLNETEVVAFNNAEDAVELCTGGGGGGVISPPLPGADDPVCFPLETQRVAVGEGPLTPPFQFGWMYLNLNVGTDDVTPGNDYDPGLFGAIDGITPGTMAQSHVAAVLDAEGLYSVGLNAVQLTSACTDADPTLVFENGGPWTNIEPYFP